MSEKNKRIQQNFRLTEMDRKILKKAVENGCARDQSDALRTAIRMYARSLEIPV